MIKFTKIFPETVPGLIFAWISSTSVPDDEMFLECNGSILTLSERYTPLYNMIGNIYGGVAGVSFGLPDYRGVYLMGDDATSNVGDIGNSFVGYHSHISTGGPSVASTDYINNNAGWMVAGAYTYPQIIAQSRAPADVAYDSDSKPKTMYVKYYISY